MAETFLHDTFSVDTPKKKFIHQTFDLIPPIEIEESENVEISDEIAVSFFRSTK